MTIKRLTLTAATLGALAVPAAALATDDATPATTPSASSQCQAQRTALGTTAFGQLYGTNANHKNAFGKCVSKLSSSQDEAATDASKACKAEQATDATAFANKYGTNANKKNAFGKCMSKTQTSTAVAEQKATISAAKTCKTEQAAGPAAFTAKYGTGANKHNAFGKCVSAIAKTQSDS